MRNSYTYTQHWDIETRQHELLGLDLGEGIPRTTLKYGFIFFPVWWGLLLLVAGFPSKPLMVPLFLLPPLLLTFYGAKRSTAYWRRTNLLLWQVRAGYLALGVRPVIGRGRVPAPRLGLRLRTQRLGERAPHLEQMPMFGPAFAAGEEADVADSCGKSAQIRPRLRLYGPDAVSRARAKTAKRTRRKD
ncbi:hypothetical protein [Streptomyces luteireticuli]|uniref:hypothetical protein n=1 Tax=Streptomyces luteireticuli TaxID=173858 RepID=UPI003557CEE6